jgi:hypothetical protein
MAIDHGHSESDGASGNDDAAILGLIDKFAEGIRSLDGDLVASIFHPDASSFSLTPRGICIEPAKAWADIMKQARGDESHLFHELFSVRVLNIDIAGSVATAKVEWSFESARIVDFYNLLKTDSGWVITNQVYHTFPPGESD